MEYEKQLTAMKTIMEALVVLEDSDKRAVLSWVNAQVGFSPPSKSSPEGLMPGVAPPATRQGTVNVVANKLGVKSARDLLTAAAAHLTLYQGKDTFTKDELVSCAKEARGWKVAYRSQMAMNIKRMADAGTLFEKTRDVFSLSDAGIAEIEERLLP